MGKKLIVTKHKGRIFSMLLDEKGRAVDISVDSPSGESILDNVYIGRVNNVLKNIHASFVEFKKNEMGFIPDVLKPGQKVTVQVIKDAYKGKEPMLSRDCVFTGKYVVLRKKMSGVHFSYKFKDHEKKEKIKGLYNDLGIEDCGIIIRTKALYADEESIMSEIKSTYAIYCEMKADAEKKPLFSCIYRAPDSYISYLINSRQNEISQVVTDDEDIYREITMYTEKSEPGLKSNIRFYNDDLVPLSIIYNLRRQVERALSEKVYLDSGAYIVIQRTEALTVIDVNSGTDVSECSMSEEYLKINLEAAEEVARQIRLRNISGIILIDYINMANIETRLILMESFKKMLDKDPLGPNVVDMTKLGIVEVTRKRGRRQLAEIIPENFFN